MIYFYWMDRFQSQHRKKEKAFAKAKEYLDYNGLKRRHYIDFLDTKNEDDQGKEINLEFDLYVDQVNCQY